MAGLGQTGKLMCNLRKGDLAHGSCSFKNQQDTTRFGYVLRQKQQRSSFSKCLSKFTDITYHDNQVVVNKSKPTLGVPRKKETNKHPVLKFEFLCFHPTTLCTHCHYIKMSQYFPPCSWWTWVILTMTAGGLCHLKFFAFCWSHYIFIRCTEAF